MLAGLASAAAAVGVTASSAQAAFSIPECGAAGAQVTAQGSTFQTVAQQFWSGQFAVSTGCNGAEPSPSYVANGSGNGNASMGAGGGKSLNCGSVCSGNGLGSAPGFRDPTTRFAGSDEAPNATQIAASDNGPTTATSDDGQLHVIPAALGAATFIVHLPAGCDVTGAAANNGLTGGADDTGDTAADQTQRVKVPNANIEKAFAGDTDMDTWGELVPGVDATCGAKFITRVVRQDTSGTTLSFKTFLDKINPSRGWLSTYGGAATLWPKGNGDATAIAPTAPSSGTACPTGQDTLCSSASSGGGKLAGTVSASDGSIGYVALSDARGNGFEVTPTTAPAAPDLTYWTPLQDLTPAAGYHEPTTDPTAHKANTDSSKRGSACASVPISSNLPAGQDPTLNGDFSKVTAIGTPSYAGYPDCVLTYELAWDDDAPVYGVSNTEEQNARVIKDYLGKVVVASAGQLFTGTDYSKLPANLLTIAQNGVAAIGWNKSAVTSGGGGTTAPTPAPAAPAGPAATIIPLAPTAPSNRFSLTSSSSSYKSGLAFKVQLPGAGRISAKATTKVGRKTITVGTVSATVSGAGTVKITLKLSAATRTALKKAKGKKLSVKTTIAFTPQGGSAATTTKTLTVKAPAAKKSSTKKKK